MGNHAVKSLWTAYFSPEKMPEVPLGMLRAFCNLCFGSVKWCECSEE